MTNNTTIRNVRGQTTAIVVNPGLEVLCLQAIGSGGRGRRRDSVFERLHFRDLSGDVARYAAASLDSEQLVKDTTVVEGICVRSEHARQRQRGGLR